MCEPEGAITTGLYTSARGLQFQALDYEKQKYLGVPSFTIFSYGMQNMLWHLEHQGYYSHRSTGTLVSRLAGWFLFRVPCEAVSQQMSGPLLPEG